MATAASRRWNVMVASPGKRTGLGRRRRSRPRFDYLDRIGARSPFPHSALRGLGRNHASDGRGLLRSCETRAVKQRGIRSWLMDLDGVLVRDEHPIPGAPEFLRRLAELE